MKTDVIIIGGGPGGAASAMFLQKHGIRSTIVEKNEFPRYHIGESMTGECGGLVRELGLTEKMLEAGHPIKRGVTVYGTGGKNSWYVPVMMRDADWNLKPQYTWQVRRSEFDKMMLDEAVSRGADLVHGQASEPLFTDDGAVRGVRVNLPNGKTVDMEAEVVLDVTGQNTFFANAGVTGPKFRGNYDKQIAIFSQVEDAIRGEGENRDDTYLFYKSKFHWSWFIPIDDRVTSVGVVIPSSYFQGKKESRQDFLLRELAELNPELSRRTPKRDLIEETRSIVNYSFEVRKFTGRNYICVGDAHRFIDPIFSFGLFITMQEAKMAAAAVARFMNGEGRDLPNPFIEHEIQCDRAIDMIEDVVDTFWENPLAFSAFVHIRHRDLMIDLLAGRLYEHQPSRALLSMRKLLQRERADRDTGSTPEGSRYHPERAEIGLGEYKE